MGGLQAEGGTRERGILRNIVRFVGEEESTATRTSSVHEGHHHRRDSQTSGTRRDNRTRLRGVIFVSE